MAVGNLGNGGALRIRREAPNRIDTGVDVVGQLLSWVISFDFDKNNTDPLSRGRSKLLNTVKVMDCLFNADRNLLFNLSRTRAAKLHSNLNLIDFRCRKELLIQLGNTGVATNNEQHHQKIGCNGVLNEPRYRSAHIS